MVGHEQAQSWFGQIKFGCFSLSFNLLFHKCKLLDKTGLDLPNTLYGTIKTKTKNCHIAIDRYVCSVRIRTQSAPGGVLRVLI